MPGTTPPDFPLESRRDFVSEHASDWSRQFIKHFELNFVDTSLNLPTDASTHDYHVATVRAMFQTLLDSGMSTDSVMETIGQVSIERRPESVEWNAELNQRRFALIDKGIQETLTPAEKFELAGLTSMMREQIESEANLPIEGAKALHRKLLKLKVPDGSR